MERDKRDDQELESEAAIDDMEGGEPGVTRETVEKARKANPEQAPGLPSEPPHVEPGDPNRPRRLGPST